MMEDPHIPHLSQIQTQWSMILQAHQGPSDEADTALDVLVRRYGGSVYRYILHITRNPETAADLTQEFALKFVRGDFRRADPRTGRFRNFLKTTVLHLVIDHHRRNRNRPTNLIEDSPEPESEPSDIYDLDSRFLGCWRDELLANAWAEFERIEAQSRRPYYTVLRLRADNPEIRSPEMAIRLSERLGKKVDANWVRQNLHRARERFIALIVDEVSRSLGDSSPERINEELMDIGLWDYCRAARRRSS